MINSENEDFKLKTTMNKAYNVCLGSSPDSIGIILGHLVVTNGTIYKYLVEHRDDRNLITFIKDRLQPEQTHGTWDIYNKLSNIIIYKAYEERIKNVSEKEAKEALYGYVDIDIINIASLIRDVLQYSDEVHADPDWDYQFHCGSTNLATLKFYEQLFAMCLVRYYTKTFWLPKAFSKRYENTNEFIQKIIDFLIQKSITANNQLRLHIMDHPHDLSYGNTDMAKILGLRTNTSTYKITKDGEN